MQSRIAMSRSASWLSLLAACAFLLPAGGAQAAVTTRCNGTLNSTNCTKRIPDAVGNTSTAIISTIPVAACPSTATKSTISASVNINHSWIGDLQITLTSPTAQTVTLVSNLADDTGSFGGCQGNNIIATFSDTGIAATCSNGLLSNPAPLQSMAPFAVNSFVGTWTLSVKDTQNGGDGILKDWAIIASCGGILDIDDNKAIDALTDGLLVLRYLFGLNGASLTTSAVDPAGNRTNPAAVKNYLDSIRTQLDVDANGTADALTDGVMILRYMFGLTGTSLTDNAVASGALRSNSAAIQAYIQSLTQ